MLEYEIVGEFLADIRKEFGGGDKKSVKVAELKRWSNKLQGRTIERYNGNNCHSLKFGQESKKHLNNRFKQDLL